MALTRNPHEGEIIQSATDPAAGGSYIVNARTLWLDTSGSPSQLKERNASNTAWNTVGGGSVQGGLRTDEFTATANQTLFTLTLPPIALSTVVVTVNQYQQSIANIVGLTGSTLEVAPGLESGDTVWITYSDVSPRFNTQEFVATSNQTIFTLAYPPAAGSSIRIALNQILQSTDTVVSVAGPIVTVVSGLDAGDNVWITYFSEA